MPTLESEITQANRDQEVSEIDTFTTFRYHQFFRHFPTTAEEVLDVGCNTGRGGQILKNLQPNVRLTGLDCVPERVEALDKSVYAGAVCSFTQELALPSKSMDVVVAGEFLEHVPPEQVQPTLCELFRVLRLRGRLLMTTPNPYSIWKIRRKTSVMLDSSHLTQHYPECLKLRLKMIGFSNIRICGSGKASLKIGEKWPLFLYGSYLIRADKW